MADGKEVKRMANSANIAQKSEVVKEIKERFQDAKSVVIFNYRGLSVADVTELRKKLKEIDADYKVYKNTLTRRALNELKIDMDEYLDGPNAITFGKDELSIVKILGDFAKNHNVLELKAGIVEGKIVGLVELEKYAAIPSRETLLTMLAAGLLGTLKDLSICLEMYAESKEN